MRKRKTARDPLEGMSLEEVIHFALGKAKDHADMAGMPEMRDFEQATAWAATAQAAATFHLSLTIRNTFKGD